MKNYSIRTPKKMSRFRTPSLYLAKKTRLVKNLKAGEKIKKRKYVAQFKHQRSF